MATRHRHTIMLDQDDDGRLRDAARRYDERPSDLIRRAVTQFLDYIAATEQHLARLTPRDEDGRR